MSVAKHPPLSHQKVSRRPRDPLRIGASVSRSGDGQGVTGLNEPVMIARRKGTCCLSRCNLPERCHRFFFVFASSFFFLLLVSFLFFVFLLLAPQPRLQIHKALPTGGDGLALEISPSLDEDKQSVDHVQFCNRAL